MKKILIYYSHTGNGDYVSSFFKEKGYDIRKVTEKKKMPKSFFIQIMVGGFRAGIGAKGKLVNYSSDVDMYDEIVIASPIWNGKFPPATNAILSKTNLSNKKVSFVLYSGSGTGAGATKKINKLFKNAPIIYLKEPKKYPEEIKKLEPLF